MNDVDARLGACFAAVFPALTPQQILSASTSTLAAWDSLAMIQLATLVDEEFATETDFDMLPELSSFDAFRRYVEQAK